MSQLRLPPEDIYVSANTGFINTIKMADTDIRYRQFPFQMHRYPTSFQATDCVIIDTAKRTLLLGRKPKENKFRFVGGFVDPKDTSLEVANLRERIEEAGMNLECTPPSYLFSFRVDDPRYRDKSDKIMSAVFLYNYIFGFAKAGDDIGEVRWFNIDDVKENYKHIIMQEHHPLVEKLIEKSVI